MILAQEENEELNDDYTHYWYGFNIDKEKYIQNTGSENIDIYTYDNVQFTTVSQLPNFPLDQQYSDSLDPGEKIKVENSNKTMQNYFELLGELNRCLL